MPDEFKLGHYPKITAPTGLYPSGQPASVQKLYSTRSELAANSGPGAAKSRRITTTAATSNVTDLFFCMNKIL